MQNIGEIVCIRSIPNVCDTLDLFFIYRGPGLVSNAGWGHGFVLPKFEEPLQIPVDMFYHRRHARAISTQQCAETSVLRPSRKAIGYR